MIKISPKICVKTMLMTKPVILSPKSTNSQNRNMRQTIVAFGKDVLFAKFRTMILNIAKNTQKPCEETNIGCAIFQNCPEKWKT